MRSLAVYTVIYPAALSFLPAFWQGLRDQLLDGFELYLSLDAVTERDVVDLIGDGFDAILLEGPPGASPAEIRCRALAEIIQRHEGVILLDSDDVPLAGRLEAAHAALERVDVYGCALELIDEAGARIAAAPFTLEEPRLLASESDPLLARVNAFGFSNTAYRSDVLAACLDAPPHTVMLDWLVASRAHLAGASFTFDARPRMLYRQYGSNTARVLAPFASERVFRDARRVMDHFGHLLDAPHGHERSVAPFEAARSRATRFASWLENEGNLRRYTERLNARPGRTYLWWEHVAAKPSPAAHNATHEYPTVWSPS